jgi:hypothetical protein
MNRKILGTCAALAALGAFAITPAMSSAAFLMDTVGGQLMPIPKDKKLVAYNELGTSMKIKVGAFTVECSEVTMTGPVHANHDATGNVLWTIEDVWFRGGASETRCTDNNTPATVLATGLTNEGGKEHWCFKNPFGTDIARIEPRNCTEGAGGAFKIAIITTGITCTFALNGNLEGTASTGDVENKPLTLLFPTQEFGTAGGGEHSIFCPANIKIENLLLQVYTDTDVTGPTYRHAGSVADPVFLIKQ